MKNITVVDPTEGLKTLYVVNFVYHKNNTKIEDEDFLKEALPLWEKYEIKKVFSMKVNVKEAIVGANTMEKPDEIIVMSVKNTENFNAFLNDDRYHQLIQLREKTVRKLTYVVGTHIEYREMSSEAPMEQRMYALGMIYYKPGGRAKIGEFAQKAVPLFMKHSFYADKFLHLLDKGAMIGEADDFTLPDELRIFWADTEADLKNYNNDPDYHAIKGIREEGVADYPTFLGKYTAD